MRYHRIPRNGEHHLAVRDGDDAFDLTSAAPDIGSLLDLLRVADDASESPTAVARRHLDAAERLDVEGFPERATVPVVPGEVWAAGVTYRISEEAREAESRMPEVYLDVYDAERPELFFKASADRTVGPGEAVGIRGDSTWDVPEPELGVVLFRGDVVGYTVGNDVSSREIEGANPLYLPQAKVYDRCCALGPCVTVAEALDDPHDLGMSMTIERDGDVVFEGATSTSRMVRTCEELVSYYRRHNVVPELSVLLTGTSLVPGDEFTLRPDDIVSIEVDEIGRLENPVVEV